jgi:hypothetical protein
MLTGMPISWFSSSYTIKEDERVVAKLDISCSKEAGVFSVDATTYRINRYAAPNASALETIGAH